MQTVLIDTDIAINFLRGSEPAKTFLVPLLKENLAFLSILSVYELYAGMREKESEITERFIQACRIAPITLEITRCASKTYQTYRKKGVTLTTIDCLIWATAKSNNHKIATQNLRHYPDQSILIKQTVYES